MHLITLMRAPVQHHCTITLRQPQPAYPPVQGPRPLSRGRTLSVRRNSRLPVVTRTASIRLRSADVNCQEAELVASLNSGLQD
jgi:hypothetical protein